MVINRVKLSVIALTILFSVALVALIPVNPYISLALGALFLAVVLLRKNTYNLIFLAPIFSAAFLPSLYISQLRLSTPAGDLRPPFIIIIFVILFTIFYKKFTVETDVLKRTKGVALPLFLLFTSSMVTMFLSGDYLSNFRYFFYIVLLGLGTYTLVAINYKLINPYKIMKYSVLISTVVCLIGFLEFSGIQPYAKYYLLSDPEFAYSNRMLGGLPRISSSIGNPLVLSYFLLLFVPFILYIMEKESKKFFWNIILLIHISAILLTFSRSAMLLLALIMIYYLFKTMNIVKIIKYSLLVIMAAIVVMFTLYQLGLIDSFIDRMLFRTNSSSIFIRLYAFSIIPDILDGRYIFGAGGTAAGEYLKQYSAVSRLMTLDNIFLTVFVSSGMLGLFFFIFPLVYLFNRYRKLEKMDRFTGNSLLIIFVGAGMSFDFITYETVWGVFWYMTALLIMVNLKKRDGGVIPVKNEDVKKKKYRITW